MILRRLMGHMREQNWFAVVLDFVIVVGGVVFGIQVSNWNDTLKDKAYQSLVETRLITDFTVISEEIDQSSAYLEQVILSLHTLKRAIMRGEALPEEDDAIKFALNRGFSYPQISQRSGTLIELLSSGRLDLIEDEDMRLALVQYDENAQNRRFNLSQIRNYLNTVVPNMNLYKELGPLTRNEAGQIVLSPVVSYDLAGMRADPGFRAALDLMIELQTWVALNINGQQDDIATVLAALREETP